MPQKTWVVGEEVLSADFNPYVQNQVVAQFPNTAARDAQWAAPPVGALCVTTDLLVVWMWNGTAWIQLQAGNMRTVAESIVAGTRGAGSITAETVIGPPLTFNARAGAQYYALVSGLVNTSGATNTTTMNIRLGTTTAGTRIAYVVSVVSVAVSYNVSHWMPLQGLTVPGANTVCLCMQNVNAGYFGAVAPYLNTFAIVERF